MVAQDSASKKERKISTNPQFWRSDTLYTLKKFAFKLCVSLNVCENMHTAREYGGQRY